MKQAIRPLNFWEYVSRIQDEVTDEVLNQVNDDEYYECKQAILDYMYYLRNMRIDSIWGFNRGGNKCIQLVNEALKKRNIFISSNYIHISNC